MQLHQKPCISQLIYQSQFLLSHCQNIPFSIISLLGLASQFCSEHIQTCRHASLQTQPIGEHDSKPSPRQEEIKHKRKPTKLLNRHARPIASTAHSEHGPQRARPRPMHMDATQHAWPMPARGTMHRCIGEAQVCAPPSACTVHYSQGGGTIHETYYHGPSFLSQFMHGGVVYASICVF